MDLNQSKVSVLPFTLTRLRLVRETAAEAGKSISPLQKPFETIRVAFRKIHQRLDAFSTVYVCAGTVAGKAFEVAVVVNARSPG